MVFNMLIVLFITCLILIYWVTKLSANVDELKKNSQYNLEVFQQKFKEIEVVSKQEIEERERLLDRIYDLEKDNRNR